ncbi:hippocampus abundant transcript-like protein 1 [Cinnamomum micranthum f. kanehirae]|uniref:Hippocampus abundant transcript-like protein 1 n=1 Tax=Cinnamomum micranthum f. kanehirae TaxID=337451 RepID=A0A3S3QUE6_9MAGN|nr:hippocampus abundant transcript-like protein 1 [Cinnamomum micranthum f. kanehirae]
MQQFLGLGHLFVTIFLYHYAVFMVIPAITDVTMGALCPGEDECGLAIYLNGFQQAVTGLGTLIVTPLVGNLSDECGRKTLLTVPLTAAIFPLVTLAFSRTKSYFYVYYVLRIFTGMVCEGSVHCLALAYVADNVAEGQRASAFGVLSGVSSASFVLGTLTARFLSTSTTFQVAASVGVIAAVYMRAFLPDSNMSSCSSSNSSRPTAKRKAKALPDADPSQENQIFSRIPSVEDITCLLRSSTTFLQVAIVAFFNNLAESGFQASLLFYLKAQFHFNKDQFADLMLIAGFAGVISQLLLMPILAPLLGELKLLTIGLFACWAHIFLYAISWSSWVPYFAAMFSVMVVFTAPCIRTIASKQVGTNEQGKAQGCISGICSFANVISPLAFTPLTALFLSERAPFHFPGFSIMCTGLAAFIAFLQSIMIRAAPAISTDKFINTSHMQV